MKMPRTTLTLICLTAVCNLDAQFEKGDWLLEGGIQTHLEGSFGKKDIDLSQGSFTYDDSDSFGWNVSAGKFICENREIGLAVKEDWRRIARETYSIFQSPNPVRTDEFTYYDLMVALFFRRYYDLGRRWYTGFQCSLAGEYGLYAHENEIQISGFTTRSLGVSANLFVAKTLGKYFGGRVSFGNVGYSVETRSGAEGIWYTDFDLNLRNLINPNISIFWTFHGKRKNDNRD